MSVKKTPVVKEPVTLTQVEQRLMVIQGQSVLLDSDVATLYAVETKEINQAVKNNPGKFPEGYVIQLNKNDEVVKIFDHPKLKFSAVQPKAFTEKGLYMLATILKGERAVRTTLAIVETFAKIRELARTVAQLSETKEKFKQQSLMQKSGEIMADVLGDEMKTTDTETSVEINLAVLKFKHTVRRKPEA
ncbi:MAG: ORF6N domain-containing protein [Bacteroidales bacterium]|nr:ORF6N domain-containing protein [Bacteroidales bacterium]